MEELSDLLIKTVNEGTSSKGRLDILQDLRRIISVIKFHDVPERSVQSFLVRLCAAVKTERAAYSRAKESSRPSHALRLSQYGQFMRELLISALKHVKWKTIKIFYNHLLDTLPTIRDILLKPLATTYLHISLQIIDHKPHYDHLDHDLWTNMVHFCVQYIETYEATSRNSVESSDSDDILTRSAIRTAAPRTEVVLLTAVLASLVGWRSAQWKVGDIQSPLLPRICILLSMLSSQYPQETAAHIHLFSICRTLLGFAIFLDRKSTEVLTKTVIELIASGWHYRTAGIQLVMLKCLMLSTRYLGMTTIDQGLYTNIVQITMLLRSDLIARTKKGLLQVADLAFDANDFRRSVQVAGLALTPEAHVKESTMYAVQTLSRLIEFISSNDLVTSSERKPRSAKRRRTQTEQDSPVRIMDLLVSDDIHAVELGLQVLTMSLEHNESLATLIEQFVVVQKLLASESHQVQAWAHLCVAIALSEAEDSCKLLQSAETVVTLWNSSVRALTLPLAERSAAQLCSVLLSSGRVQPLTLQLSGVPLVRSVMTRGPLNLTDAACVFILMLIEVLMQHNLISVEESSEYAISWARSRMISATTYPVVERIRNSYLFCTRFVRLSDTLSIVCKPLAGSLNEIHFCTQRDDQVRNLLQNMLHVDIIDSPRLKNSAAVLNRTKLEMRTDTCQLRSCAVSLVVDRAVLNCITLKDMSMQSLVDSLEGTITVFSFFRLCHITRLLPEYCSVRDLSHALQDRLELLQVDQCDMWLLTRSLQPSLVGLFHCIATDWDTDLLTVLKTLLEAWSRFIGRWLSFHRVEFQTDVELDDFESSREHGTSAVIDNEGLSLQVLASANLECMIISLLDNIDQNSNGAHLQSLLAKTETTVLLSCDYIWQIWPLLRNDLQVQYTDLIVGWLIQRVLTEYSCERSDATHSFAIRFLSLTCSLWASLSDTSIGHSCQKIFEWLTKICFSAELSSPENRIQLIWLCTEVIEHNTDHVACLVGSGTISSRSMIVNRLNDEDFRVAHSAARASMSIFDHHEGHTHYHIHDDILGVTSVDLSSQSNARLRIYVLVLLAMKTEVCRAKALQQLVSGASGSCRFYLSVLVRYASDQSARQPREAEHLHHCRPFRHK